MSHVSVTINGRQYRMACEDGQEQHLLGLAEELDVRIQDLRGRFGEIGDMRLAVMAALMVTDELAESGKRLRQAQEELATLQGARAAVVERSQDAEDALAAALNSAAERVERLTRSLNQGLGQQGPGESVALG